MGPSEAEAYARSFKAARDQIAANPDLGRPCDHIRPGYFRHPVGSHMLFYRVVDAEIEIVRILHRRMDFERHL